MMLRRTKILLGILAITIVGSLALERAASALNPAVGANGIVWTCSSTDVCGSSGTCSRCDGNHSPIIKRNGVQTYVVAVSPSPSSSYDGECVVYDHNAAGGFKPASCGGAGSITLQNAFDNGDGTINITSTGNPVDIDDGSGDSYLNVSTSGLQSIGAWAFGNSGNDWMLLRNSSAASGGDLVERAPDITQEGRAWNGSASKLIGAQCIVTADTTGASYSVDWELRLERDAANVTPIHASYNGTTTTTVLGLAATSATLTTPILSGSVTGTYTLAGTPTITSPTISGPTFSGTEGGTRNIGGTPTLTVNLTTNGFVGPAYGGTLSNVPSFSWIEVGSGGGAPAFQNSWVNDGTATYPTAAFFKDALGQVHVKGYVKSGTVGSGTPIFTLPAGYRPLQKQFIPAFSATLGLIQIDTNGNVSVLAGSNGDITITAIFMAEQ